MRGVALAATAAIAVCLGVEASSGGERLATRAWVLQKISEISPASAVGNATVVSNGNGSVTYSSPWTSEDVTNAAAITLTFSSARIVDRQRRANASPRRFSLLDIIFTRAFADGVPGGICNALSITLMSGAWIDNARNEHPFNLGDGLVLTFDEEMPEIPDGVHTCDFASQDCTCKGSEYSESELDEMCPEEYREWTVKEYVEVANNIEHWIDESAWEDRTDDRNGTTYWISDEDGVRVSLNSIAERSDAWIVALSEGLTTLNKRMRECREAYKKSLRCNKANPQHNWGRWIAVRMQGALMRRRTCVRCGSEQTEVTELDQTTCDEANDVHYPAGTGDCGCICGKYGPNALASDDAGLHRWADTRNDDGVQPCVCKCGLFHVRREPTSYLLNARRACASICAYCRERSGNGVGVAAAKDEEHTPCETRDGRCGCLCGKLTADNTKVEKFHVQKPGTCRCFGSDGKGGAWHFPEPRGDCRRICQFLVDGKEHLAATRKNDGGIVASCAQDHTAASGSRCGCECMKFTGSNHARWEGANFHRTAAYKCGCYCGHGSEAQVPNYHKKALDTDCDCQCGATLVAHVAPTPPQCRCRGKCHAPKHFPVSADGKCPGVCHGVCLESRDQDKMERHTPEGSTRCGCQCGEIGAADFRSLAYHAPRGAPECWCSGGHRHTHTAKDGCQRLCAFCNRVPYADGTGTRLAIESDHTFRPSKCVCECGEVERPHAYAESGKTQKSVRTCGLCGREVTMYDVVYRCRRCGSEHVAEEEEGHAPDCGSGHGGTVSTTMNYCDKHKIYYSCEECPECADEGGDGDGSGGESGGVNSSVQSGNPDNIL